MQQLNHVQAPTPTSTHATPPFPHPPTILPLPTTTQPYNNKFPSSSVTMLPLPTIWFYFTITYYLFKVYRTTQATGTIIMDSMWLKWCFCILTLAGLSALLLCSSLFLIPLWIVWFCFLQCVLAMLLLGCVIINITSFIFFVCRSPLSTWTLSSAY